MIMELIIKIESTCIKQNGRTNGRNRHTNIVGDFNNIISVMNKIILSKLVKICKILTLT